MATKSIFCFPIFKNSLIPGGQINYPSSGKHFSLPFLPATPLSLSRTFEGLFELTRCHSRAHNSPCALRPELQRYKDTHRLVCWATAEVSECCQKQLTQTLIVCLMKTHFFMLILDYNKKSTDWYWVSDQTCNNLGLRYPRGRRSRLNRCQSPQGLISPCPWPV